ncbi:hypothetical protein SLS62_007895 [Diatrype stigma]|uniref:Brl1/Brr6 domain-containing protein n=1 Tax=Diatrype stigma TaxID=117547 RepID=A0AAN9ULX5_9PEZI
MDWEYQTNGPMDPSSPFVQSTKRVQEQQQQQQQQQRQQQQQQQQQRKDVFGSSSSFGAFGHNPLNRTQSTPSKTSGLPTTPSQPASIFSTSHLNRTVTAAPFRNPAFTTPRKPFDADAYSEASPAESSPAATDVSDLADTPENDRSYDLDHMTITPASVSRHKNMVSSRKQSGKGELMHTVFSNRDKVRKRKRYNENKDISGYRLPYRQHDEWDETDYDSDESTIEPGRPSSRHVSRGRSPSKNKNYNGGGNNKRDGWLSNFLSVIQRHPHAPAIMSYWLSTLFNFVVVFASFYFLYVIYSVLSEDFLLARRKARDGIVAEIERCTTKYTQNKCYPIEHRLPAVSQLCDEWYECMLQNENGTKTAQTIVLEVANVLNSVVGSLHYKTLAVLLVGFLIFCYSGTSIVKKVGGGDIFAQPPLAPPPAYPSAYYPHPADRIAWEQIAPQTPRHFNPRHMRHSNDETPESDIASPTPPPMSSFRALAPPPLHTPSSSRRLQGSPSKLMSTIERNREREWERERGRSPTKSRSPTKRY